MHNIHPNEIVYSTITVQTPSKTRKATPLTHQCIAVMSVGANWDGWLRWHDPLDAMVLAHMGLEQDSQVCKLEVISRCGFRSQQSGYSTGVANDEIRNKITGVYE